MMTCIIIEDQTPAQRILKKYIADYGQLELLNTFSNAIDALNYLQNQNVDLIFLDIHLPKISGIEFIKSLKHQPAVILTTAFSEYAVESYELNVVDYLVKPFSFIRFVQAVTKVTTPVGNQNQPTEEPLFVKSGHEFVQIVPSSILFIHSDLDYTEVHLENTKKILTNDTLANWEQRLMNKGFIRVHKSYIVHIAKIDKVVSNQITIGGTTIPIGRAFKEDFLNRVIHSTGS